MNQEIWTACNACGKRVTSNSIHTCSPQLKELTDEEIISCVNKEFDLELKADNATVLAFARAILRKAQEK